MNTGEPEKPKRSIMEIIIQKLKSKPATQEEIDQLKLEVAKAKEIRDLRIIKSQTPSKFAKILDTLTTLSEPIDKNKKRKIPRI